MLERMKKKGKEHFKQSRRDFLRGASSMMLLGILGIDEIHSFREKIYRGKFDSDVSRFKEYAHRIASKTDLENQFDKNEEPELFKKIENRDVRSTLDIINFFGHKKVVGAEDTTRIDYVRFAMQFDEIADDRWKRVQNNLRPCIPGLCAQESRFNNNERSHSGAEGIFQFMPGTWEEVTDQLKNKDRRVGKEPHNYSKLSLKDQTTVAGKHFSNIYRRLYHHAPEALEHIERIVFKNGGFEKYFLVPLMINAYNAGSKRMADIAVAFAKVYEYEKTARHTLGYYPEYDAFYALTQIGQELSTGTKAGYGKHSAEYFLKVFALSDMIQNNES